MALRWTQEEYHQFATKTGVSKRAKSGRIPHRKQEYAGMKFDSLVEMGRYRELEALEKMGEITDLKVHPRFPLEINGVKIGNYTADFQYLLGGKIVVEDVKSSFTAKDRHYRRTKKLLYAIHGIHIQEVIR